jgi:hypothetical protein
MTRIRAIGVAAALALAASPLSACSTNGDPATMSRDHAALTELGQRLENVKGHPYTAEYLIEGSEATVTVAVDPEAERAAVTIGEESSLWTADSGVELGRWFAEELAGLLPADQDVAAWLAASSEDPAAQAVWSDTTLAGQLADCAAVQGASSAPVGAFEVCVTTVGVIASVIADVEGASYSAKLVAYRDGVDRDWLDELQGLPVDEEDEGA